MAEPPLKNIGKYHIVELVGEGSMGVVYRAKDSVLDRTVAIKVMNASIARQQDLRQRFLHEAQAAGSLQHPNVVTIYDLGELDGHLFIAMEFVEGLDLEHLMDLTEPLKLQVKLDIIVDVLMGLSYAHKRGIVHRDIKPANIRIAEDGRAKIMDFGVAHLASSNITRTGLVVGTPSYMAPEQVTGGKAVPATDLFAVGAVLYQLLAGAKPFEAPTLQSLFYKIVSEMPTPLADVRPGLPPALDRIVRKAMAKEPVARYGSAVEMANELTSVRAELSGAPYPATVSLSETVATAIRAPHPSRFSTRRIASAAGGLLVVASAIVVIRSNFNRGEEGNASAANSPAGSVLAAVNDAPAAVALDSAASGRQTISPAESNAAAATPVPPSVAADKDSAPRAANRRVREPPVSAPPKRPGSVADRLRDLKDGRRDTRLDARRGAARGETPARTVSPPPPLRAPAVVTQQPSRDVPPPAAVVIQPRPLPPEPAAVRPAAPDPGDITATAAAYARAIESRDVGAIRRIYPGITSEQARGFEQFFQAVRSLNVTFRVSGVDANGSSADARFSGSYEYVTTSGKAERQPVSFAASLRHDGSSWRLVSVR
ncbi:MAG: protein kinase [Gemmatimonadaceae bacterium]|nr:protein kinase [Gemmatimonadaceae bacterium]